MIVNELTKFQLEWNLRLDKKQSEILTKENLTEIGGVKCTQISGRASVSGNEGKDQDRKGVNCQEY
jgi:hypothetical protein